MGKGGSIGNIGFGAMGLTAFYGAPKTTDEVTSILQGIYDLGCRHYDTAELYKTGNPMADSDEDVYNEQQMEPFLASVPRDTFTVATKFMPFKWGSKCDYETVKKSLQGSLDRLGLSYVDLYYIHRQVSLESSLEFAASAKRLKEEGLIKGVGFSEVCGAWIRELNSVVKLTAVQQEWSLVTRNLEEEMVPVCKELDIRIVAYSPLARNLLAVELTETPKDWRGSLPRYQPGNLAKNAALLAEVVALAKTKGCTAAQLSLAWLLEKGAQLGVTVVPIPGTTSLQHATDNINSANINLNDADMAVLEELGAKVSGLRADERYMKMGIEGQLAASEKAVS